MGRGGNKPPRNAGEDPEIKKARLFWVAAADLHADIWGSQPLITCAQEIIAKMLTSKDEEWSNYFKRLMAYGA